MRRYVPAALLGAAAIGIWELVVRAFGVADYLWPAPSRVARSLADDRSLLLSNGWVTLREIMLGLAIALAAGLAIGIVLHASAHFRRAAYPLLVGSQAMPVVLLAPILVVAFGFDIGPKLALVALVCFFPVVVGTVDGLRAVDAELVRMMRTLDASRLDVFRRVEFPSALPSIFSGARIAATYAAVGAVFGEWSGSTSGLGWVMLQSQPALLTARIFAAVVLLATISLVLFALVSYAERVLVPWAFDA